MLLALFALFATWHDVPAPDPLPTVPAITHTAPPVATVGDSPTTPHHAPPTEPPPPATATPEVPDAWIACPDGTRWQALTDDMAETAALCYGHGL
jgi:hypothetical protein